MLNRLIDQRGGLSPLWKNSNDLCRHSTLEEVDHQSLPLPQAPRIGWAQRLPSKECSVERREKSKLTVWRPDRSCLSRWLRTPSSLNHLRVILIVCPLNMEWWQWCFTSVVPLQKPVTPLYSWIKYQATSNWGSFHKIANQDFFKHKGSLRDCQSQEGPEEM